MGVVNIVQAPADPGRAQPAGTRSRFLLRNRWLAFVALGAVVLAFTGAEALYADMGHFGKRPIRIAWFAVVLPALALNYLGQGALLLRDPEAIANPFYQQLGRLERLSAGGAGDGGDRDRVAGDDLRRLLDDQAGDPAGLPAAHARSLHTSAQRDRPDLHPGRQLAAADRRCCWR